jgi:predicted house-cleaning NTP pyrophosphatase (Maf/HAM1 superfamily)
VARKHILEEMGLEFQVMVGRAAPPRAPTSDRSDSDGEMEYLWDLFAFLWVQTADIDEKSIRRENPDDLVMVLAEAKVGTRFSPQPPLAMLRCAIL